MATGGGLPPWPGEAVQGGEDPAHSPVTAAHCTGAQIKCYSGHHKETSGSVVCLLSVAAGDRTIKTPARVPLRKHHVFYWAILRPNYSGSSQLSVYQGNEVDHFICQK